MLTSMSAIVSRSIGSLSFHILSNNSPLEWIINTQGILTTKLYFDRKYYRKIRNDASLGTIVGKLDSLNQIF